jgi:putative transposase
MSTKTFKYRLFPSKPQVAKMVSILGECRWVYNHFLETRKTAWETKQETLSFYDLNKMLPKLKEERPTLSGVHSQSLQDVSKRLDLAFKAFFRRCKSGETPGYPRFRGEDRYDSFTYPQYASSFKMEDGKIYLPKVGLVKVKLHRDLAGTVKTALVRRSAGKWYLFLVCDDVPVVKLPVNKLEVGVDVGLSKFATLSDGSKISNPRFFKKEQDTLAKAQRKLAKQTKGTPERKKSRKAVSKIHERIANKRHNFCHQESKKLVDKYGLICVEDLNINKMKGKGNTVKLGKSISDVAWGLFLQSLKYKAEDAGRRVIEVNPAYTSQMCSNCWTLKKLELSDRIYNCGSCGLVLDRDLNAAKNILRLGMQSLASGLA